MVYHHEVLEHGDFSQRQQVVRWIRRFPFAFLSDREYTIARREAVEDDGSIYGISKVSMGMRIMRNVEWCRLAGSWVRWGLCKGAGVQGGEDRVMCVLGRAVLCDWEAHRAMAVLSVLQFLKPAALCLLQCKPGLNSHAHVPTRHLTPPPQAVHDHPREYKDSSVVKMDVFWSMWRSRTVPDPWGADTPACETILLHHEQFKIPENLARFAVKHGMWSFVKKLASTVPTYVEARRKRGVGSEQQDSQAYGAGAVPNPPASSLPSHLRHSDSAASLSGMGGWGSSSECGSDDSAQPGRGHISQQHGSQHSHDSGARRVRNAAVVLVAGGIALAVKAHMGGGSSSRRASCAAAASKRQQQRRHQRSQLASHRLAEVPEEGADE